MSVAAKHPAKSAAKDGFWDNVRTIAYALLLAMTIRFAFAQPFRIPSGSMQPTLMVGDFVVVTKWSYGYSRFSIAPLEALAPEGRLFAKAPDRGDIVVFRPESQPDKDFIKRLVGLPGDRIQMRRGVLYINGEPVKREALGVTPYAGPYGYIEELETFRETLPNGVSYTTFNRSDNFEFDDTGIYEVPEGRYFFMGDDRDNSADSRTTEVGYVPFDHLVGEAQFVFISFNEKTKIWQPWTMLTGIRGDRLLKGLE